jgi:DNA modification methylase
MSDKTSKEAMRNQIFVGDCIEGLKNLPDESVDCCVTSPPYFGLRDYGADDQLGLEETPEEYVENMVKVFREVKRVLKDDGTVWLNLGDSYASNTIGDNRTNDQLATKSTLGPKKDGLNPDNSARESIIKGVRKTNHGLKQKNLVGIPWRVAFALQADGWYLRQDIIWSKGNCMPESVTDRCTKSHEYIFLLSKNKKYYFDAEAIKEKTVTNDKSIRDRDGTRLNNTPGRTKMGGLVTNNYEVRNKRSVWEVNAKGFKEAHFAVYPEKLIVDCIKAGCPEGGIILDPFMGAGTTGLVARKLNRDYVGMEINHEYAALANKRISTELGLFK